MGELLSFPIKQQQADQVEQKKAPQAKTKAAPKKQAKKKSVRKDVVIPNAFGHLMVGTAVGLLLANRPVEFALVLCGSLLPDIDHRNSTFGKWNPFTRYMKHRGKCHTIIGSILLCMPFLVFGGIKVPILVFVGCMGHLLSDKVTSWLPKHKKFKLRFW